MRFLGLSLAVLVAHTLTAAVAHGAPVPYLSLGDWQAANGPGADLLEDFESQAVPVEFSDNFNVTGLNGFSLVGSDNGGRVGFGNASNAGDVNGTNFLYWGSQSGTAPTFDFVFDQPVKGFAFEWRDIDSNSAFEVVVNGTAFFNPPFSTGVGSGFFGVVESEGTIANATIRFSEGSQVLIQDFGIDNVRVAAVPEPASFAALGVVACSVGGGALRRRLRRQPSAA